MSRIYVVLSEDMQLHYKANRTDDARYESASTNFEKACQQAENAAISQAGKLSKQHNEVFTVETKKLVDYDSAYDVVSEGGNTIFRFYVKSDLCTG